MALSLEASVSWFYPEYEIYKIFLILCEKSEIITDWFGFFLPKWSSLKSNKQKNWQNSLMYKAPFR